MKILKKVLTSVLALILLGVVVSFVAIPIQVIGSSMEPAIQDRSYYLVLNPRLTRILHGDVVTYRFKETSNFATTFVGRVIALPGDTVRITDGRIYLNEVVLEEPYLAEDIITRPYISSNLQFEKPTLVPDGSYFILSDKRESGRDSRTFGFIPAKSLLGKLAIKIK